MKKIAVVAVGIVICGGLVFANQVGIKSLNFIAPGVDDKGAILDPVEGEIVYEKNGSGAGFWGKTDGGNWVSMGGSTSVLPPGVILPFGGTTAPPGYVLAHGQSITCDSTHQALCDALGTTFGNGTKNADGSSSGCTGYPDCINVPDMRGRFMRGADLGAGRDPSTSSGDRPAMNVGGNTGGSVGSIQGQATKKNGLTATSTDLGHSHSLAYPTGGGGTMAIQPLAGNGSYTGSMAGMATGQAIISTIIGAGDAETRPINANVNYIVKL